MKYFTKSDAWNGGCYELAIEVNSIPEKNLFSILSLIWNHPMLEGCYLLKNKEPHEQEKQTFQEKLARRSNIYGLANLENKLKVACGTNIVRLNEKNKWVSLFIPMGSLSNIYPVGGYPFSNQENISEWQNSVEAWFKNVAETIYKNQHFPLALLGFEVLGECNLEELKKFGIPGERYFSYFIEIENKLEFFEKNCLPTYEKE